MAIDVLALMDEAEQELFAGSLEGFRVRAASDPTAFLRELEIERPRVVVISAPPATPATIEHVAIAGEASRPRLHARGLIDGVWGPGHEGNPRTVDVHIRWLRSKVERDPDVPLTWSPCVAAAIDWNRRPSSHDRSDPSGLTKR